MPRISSPSRILLLVALAGLSPALPQAVQAAWTFTDVTDAAGLRYEHNYVAGLTSNPRKMAGGVAAADYDGDGWIDLFAVVGDHSTDKLFRNLGNGTFQEVGNVAGVAAGGRRGCGPSFADYNGDGLLDLFIGGVGGTPPILYRNVGGGLFEDATAGTGWTPTFDTFSAAFGDYDANGTLDLFMSHWGVNQSNSPGHLWRNEGDGSFVGVDAQVGLTDWGASILDWTFTGNFCDIDNDGALDVLVASDFNTSRVFLNTGAAAFTNATTSVITDENGMGTSLGDYDNDGDLDWFVSCIWDPATLLTGNRLYRNDGGGAFADVTDAAGVRDGGWGWGGSFADFNNDGFLDLVHVNGWYHPTFVNNATRMFVSNGDGTFTESASSLGCADTGQGRGLACLDYDRDGDLDLALANNAGFNSFYRNDLSNGNHWLQVELKDGAPNHFAVGARVRITTGAVTQMREVRVACNFVSQDPLVQHFGLGAATLVDEVRIDWPGGGSTTLNDVAADQLLTIDRTATAAPIVGLGGAEAEVVASPNPFTAGTRISFVSPRSGTARWLVHDARGRLVASAEHLVSEGRNAISWDGRGPDGERVPPGVYFFRVDAPAGSVAGKVVHVR